MHTYLRSTIARSAGLWPVCTFISEEAIPAHSDEDQEVRQWRWGMFLKICPGIPFVLGSQPPISLVGLCCCSVLTPATWVCWRAVQDSQLKVVPPRGCWDKRAAGPVLQQFCSCGACCYTLTRVNADGMRLTSHICVEDTCPTGK